MRHREAFHTAIRDIVLERLAKYGMETYHLSGSDAVKQSELIMHPDPDTSVPHIPILASKDISTTRRVFLLFGESSQDLGIFAHRIIGMRGGINAGSAVNFIRTVLSLEINAETGLPLAKSKTGSMQVKLSNPEKIDLTEQDVVSPGVIMANMGQLCWARSQGRAISHVSWDALPRPSAVDSAVRFHTSKNTVPGHRTEAEHVASIFQHVVPQLCAKGVQIHVIAIGDSCEHIPLYLDQHWNSIKTRINIESMAMICPGFAGETEEAYTNEEFKLFLKERTRGWLEDEVRPAGNPLFGPHGGSKAWQRAFGYNMYSLPSENASEMVFPKHFHTILQWITKVAGAGEEYCEDEIAHVDVGDEEEDTFFEGEVWAPGESAVERGLITEAEWGMDEGALKLAKTEEEREAIRAQMKARKETNERIAAEGARVNAEWEKNWGNESDGKNGIIGGPKRDEKGNPVYEIAETDTEHPEAYEWHERDGSKLRWRWMTKEEMLANEDGQIKRDEVKKEKIEKQKKLKEQKAWKEKVGSTIVTTEEVAADAAHFLSPPSVTADQDPNLADLPPSYTEATEICTKSSVEAATKSIIAEMKTLDIASHTELPSTPQCEVKQPKLAIRDRTPLDEISDDEEEFSLRDSSSALSPLTTKQGQTRISIKSMEGTSFNGKVTTYFNATKMGIDGTNDEEYMACPPERMERLPSDVALGLHTGQPEVKLTKDQKAAILQTTVLSSPVKADDEGRP